MKPPTAKRLASKPLTRWSALMICMEHWNYIAECEDGSLVKAGIAMALGMDNFDQFCACCEYDLTNGSDTCSSCPIAWNNGHCGDDPGEFRKYCDNPSKETALAIAYLAEYALDDLGEDQPWKRTFETYVEFFDVGI